MMEDHLFEAAVINASSRIASWDEVIHIGYTFSADAIISATIVARTLMGLEHPFVLFQFSNITKQIERRGEDKVYIFLGGEIEEEFPAIPEYLWITEPTKSSMSDDKVINATEYGYKYLAYGESNEEDEVPFITIAAITREIMMRIDEDAAYNLLPLVAEQSLNMMSPPQGYHHHLLQLAKESGLAEEIDALKLFGAEHFSVVQTLENSYNPFFPQLTNQPENVKKFLKSITRKGQNNGIPVERGKEVRTFSDLSREELIDLNKALLMHLNKNTGYREVNTQLFSKKVLLQSEEHYSVLHNTWDYAQAIIDAMHKDKIEVAIAVLLGDRSLYYEQLTRLFEGQREVLNSVFSFFKSDDIQEYQYFRYLETGDKVDWYNSYNLPAMALSSGLVEIDKPFLVICPGPGDRLTLNLRASSTLDLHDSLLNIVRRSCENLELASDPKGDEYGAIWQIDAQDLDETMNTINQLLGEQTNEIQN